MGIEELKRKVLNNEFEKNELLTSVNDKGEDIIFIQYSDIEFMIQTMQSNGWIRKNIYTYDKESKIWTEEEIYER